MSDENQHCLYCLDETHIIALCSTCCSFPLRTHEVREFRRKKHLMEEAMRLCAHTSVEPMDPPERPAAPTITASPATTPAEPTASMKADCAHKKHSHGHKGGPRGGPSPSTAFLLCASFLSPSYPPLSGLTKTLLTAKAARSLPNASLSGSSDV